MKGAEAQGLECLFIAGGIHAAELAGPSGGVDPAKAQAFLSDAGTRARWLSQGLAW